MLEIVLREKRWKSIYMFYTKNCFKAKALKYVRGFFICKSPIIHLPPPPCAFVLSSISLRIDCKRRNWKQSYAKFCRANKVYYGGCANGENKEFAWWIRYTSGQPGSYKIRNFVESLKEFVYFFNIPLASLSSSWTLLLEYRIYSNKRPTSN